MDYCVASTSISFSASHRAFMHQLLKDTLHLAYALARVNHQDPHLCPRDSQLGCRWSRGATLANTEYMGPPCFRTFVVATADHFSARQTGISSRQFDIGTEYLSRRQRRNWRRRRSVTKTAAKHVGSVMYSERGHQVVRRGRLQILTGASRAAT